MGDQSPSRPWYLCGCYQQCRWQCLCHKLWKSAMPQCCCWTNKVWESSKIVLVNECFRDNAAGGNNGPESVNLLDPAVNSQFTYLLAAHDFDFHNNGDSFLSSCATFQIANNVQGYDFPKLTASSINITHQYYFFGCLAMQSSKYCICFYKFK